MSERTEDEINDEIATLVSEIAALRHPEQPPFVKSWALVALVQNGEMLQRNVEHSEYIHPSDQSIVTTLGLHTLAQRDLLQDNDE